MSIKSAPYYYAECDLCETNITEECGEHSAWSDRSYVVTAADDHGFAHSVNGEREIVLCEDCAYHYRSDLDDDEWDALHDREAAALAALGAWIDSQRTVEASGER